MRSRGAAALRTVVDRVGRALVGRTAERTGHREVDLAKESSPPSVDPPGEDAVPSGNAHQPACWAPSTNLYFAATGAVGPCWIQLGTLGESWGPDRSIRDVWSGEVLEHLRAELAQQRFPGACSRCEADIRNGLRPLAAIYERERPVAGWPTTLELELSNVCNFECVMCNGDLSSKIRRNREHRPPLESPYDDSFVDQLAELLPTLQRVRFSGGEPMLHPILFKICDRIVEVRPDLRIDISTNGSMINDRVRGLLARAKVQINVSFESLRPDRYQRIRVGSDHDLLMANIDEFRELVRPNGGLVTVNTNPMRDTWDEMADIVRYCDGRDLHLSFNTVVEPLASSLRGLPAAELAVILDQLAGECFDPPAEGSAAEWNHVQFDNFVGQVSAWLDAASASSAGSSVSIRRSSGGGT